MPIEFQNADECLFELLVDERVAERIDRTVQITQPIRDIVEGGRYARPPTDWQLPVNQSRRSITASTTEADQKRKDVPRSPAQYERTEDNGDRPESLK